MIGQQHGIWTFLKRKVGGQKAIVEQGTFSIKAQRSKNEDHGIRSHHFMGNRWGNSGNSVRLYFFFGWGAPKSLQMVIAAMKLKDFLGRKLMTNLDSILKSKRVG